MCPTAPAPVSQGVAIVATNKALPLSISSSHLKRLICTEVDHFSENPRLRSVRTARGHCSPIDGVLAYIFVPASNLGFQNQNTCVLQTGAEQFGQVSEKSALCTCRAKGRFSEIRLPLFACWRVTCPRRVSTQGFRTCSRYQGASI